MLGALLSPLKSGTANDVHTAAVQSGAVIPMLGTLVKVNSHKYKGVDSYLDSITRESADYFS